MLGQQVQAVMDAKGVSMRQLATGTGIPNVTLNRKLRGLGKTPLNFPELCLIAEYLGCRVAALIPEELLT